MTLPKRRHIYVEDVEFLREQGAGDAEILTQLKVTAHALSRGLYRAGRPDLGRPFARIAKAARSTADETAGKPNPRMLHELMRELGVPPERTLMIGDTTHG